jgi:hypothetical protein
MNRTWRVAFDNPKHIVGTPMEVGVDYIDVEAGGVHEAIEIAKELRAGGRSLRERIGDGAVLSVFPVGRPMVSYLMAGARHEERS